MAILMQCCVVVVKIYFSHKCVLFHFYRLFNSISVDSLVFKRHGVFEKSISVKIVLLLSLLMKKIIRIIPVLELIIFSMIITGW